VAIDGARHWVDVNGPHADQAFDQVALKAAMARGHLAHSMKQIVEDLAVDRLTELESSFVAIDPANRRFERRQHTELHPDDLTDPGSLDELGHATAFRQVVNFHEEVELSAAPKEHLGVDGPAGDSPCV
jgi:hypothetical protein